MIKVYLYRNKNNKVYRFKVRNHGDSIVCAAVSALVITTVNFIEARLNIPVKQKHHETGFIDFQINDIKNGKPQHDASLLIEAMVFGLQSIQKTYHDEICIYNG